MAKLASRTLFGMVAVLVTVGCGSSDDAALTGGNSGRGGSGAADGSAASGGRGGASGAAGALGSSGNAGSAGQVGSSGAAGSSGANGSAGIGSGGDAGSATGGTAGSSTGGTAGSATAGSGGDAGSAAGGTAGAAGTGGLAGTAGEPGDASAGTAGDASAGSAGIDGGSVGSAGQDGSADSSAGGTAGNAGSASGGTNGAPGDGSAGTNGTGGTAGDAGDAGTQCDDPSDCDNGTFCDGAEQCTNGFCVAGSPVVCAADGFSCTQEICSESSKACASVPQASNCDDGVFCNGAEGCAPTAGNADARGCTPGTAPPCNDGVACTTDSCSNTTRACVFTPVHQSCSDGLYCTGNETCDPSNPAAVNGCVAGVPVDCEDGIACTADSCSNSTSSCTHVPNHLSCTDGLPCNGAEQCDATPGTGGCKAGTPVVCGNTDGIACTVESCDQATGTCDVTPNNALCPSGQTCTIGGCTNGPTCPGGTNAECQDGNQCNGAEVCVTGICRPGTAVNCNDSIDCTVDDCNPSTGVCSHTPHSGFCDDRDPCNGTESCDSTPGTGGCKNGPAITCNDGISCTSDTCVVGFGCEYTPDNSVCQDTLLCNGSEVCDPTPVTGGCKAGTAPTCQSDGIACTQESCVEPFGCVSTPNDSLCPCGQTCSATQGGCGNFCRISQCSGKLYQCGDCIDNDADCKIDSFDEHCTGVCDNTENHLYPNLPGAPGGPCKLDCFFDNGNGSGNDDCYWDHKCDPLAVAPNYPPEGLSCAYDPTSRPGPGLTCQQALTAQSSTCTGFCGPLVPNGCDCFGCCAIPGAPTTVWLGSEDGSDNGLCTLSTLADPTKCKPCTQVPACLNTCERCELCLGKPTIPADCNGQTCPPGRQACGLAGQAPCPQGQFCVTGCCQNNPGE